MNSLPPRVKSYAGGAVNTSLSVSIMSPDEPGSLERRDLTKAATSGPGANRSKNPSIIWSVSRVPVLDVAAVGGLLDAAAVGGLALAGSGWLYGSVAVPKLSLGDTGWGVLGESRLGDRSLVPGSAPTGDDH